MDVVSDPVKATSSSRPLENTIRLVDSRPIATCKSICSRRRIGPSHYNRPVPRMAKSAIDSHPHPMARSHEVAV
jgi:hypothetical protein